MQPTKQSLGSTGILDRALTQTTLDLCVRRAHNARKAHASFRTSRSTWSSRSACRRRTRSLAAAVIQRSAPDGRISTSGNGRLSRRQATTSTWAAQFGVPRVIASLANCNARNALIGARRLGRPARRLSRGFRVPAGVQGFLPGKRLTALLYANPAFGSAVSAWSDKSTNNYASQQELDVSREATGSVPTVAAVKQLVSTWAQKRYDVLKIRSGARRCSESPRIQQAAPDGEEHQAG